MTLRPIMFATAIVLFGTTPVATQNFSRWIPLCGGLDQAGGIALGDLDGDRDLDVVFANGQHLGQTDWVFSNDGRGSFSEKRPLAATALSASSNDKPDPSYGVALGDLDGDGTLDAVIANDATVSVAYRNDGKGNFSSLGSLGTAREPRRAVALGDLDKDGDLDAVLVGLGQDHVYLNDGEGRSWTERVLASRAGTIGRATGVAVADLNGDGNLDIVIPGRYEAENLVFINDGRAGFTEMRRFGVAHEDPTSVAVGDVDGDGDADLVTGNWEQRHVVYANDGHGQFKERARFGSGQEQTWTVALGDMDLDGDLDAVVANVNVGYWRDDLNGDGIADRFGQRVRAMPSRVYLNDGRGGFTPGSPITTGGENTRPIALGDVDRDGDLDIVMGNSCQANYVFFNSVRGPKVPVADPALSKARDQWYRATQNGDRTTYASFLSEDATWVDFTGMIGDKSALLNESPLRVTGDGDDVRLYSSGAVVMGIRGGGILRDVQVWVRNGVRWQMAATQEVRVGGEPIRFWPPMKSSSSLPPDRGAANDQHSIQKMTQALRSAIQAGDVKQITANTTAEFVAVSANGEVRNREQWLQNVGETQRRDVGAYDEVQESSTRIYFDLAIWNGVARDANGQRFINTLIAFRQKGRWVLAGAVTTPIAGSIP